MLWQLITALMLFLFFVGKYGFIGINDLPKYWDFIYGRWITELIPTLTFIFFGAALAAISGGKKKIKFNRIKFVVGLLLLLRDMMNIVSLWAFANGPSWLNFYAYGFFSHLFLSFAGHYNRYIGCILTILGGFLTVNSFYGNEE